MAKRQYNYPMELERLQESFYNVYGKSIRDKEGFDKAWEDYFKDYEMNDFLERSKPEVENYTFGRNMIGGDRLPKTKTIKGKTYQRRTINGQEMWVREQEITYVRYYDENGKQIQKPEQ